MGGRLRCLGIGRGFGCAQPAGWVGWMGMEGWGLGMDGWGGRVRTGEDGRVGMDEG